MHDFLITKDGELRDIVLDDPYVLTLKVKEGEVTKIVPKPKETIQ